MTRSKLKYLIKSICLLTSFGVATSVDAIDLVGAYQLGMKNDPTYQAAAATYLSEQEKSPQAWSAVFPQLTANADISRSRRQLVGTNDVAHLESYDYGVNLSQVIFDFSVFKRIQAASATVKQAAFTLAAAKQDLMMRVVRAYFNVLLAQDNLSFTKKQSEAALRQLDATKERYKVGHATITSLDQFRGQYESLQAQVYSDKITLSNQLQALGEVIGRDFTKLSPLKRKFTLKKPIPKKLSKWLANANQQNLSLTAARYGLEAARKNIGVAQGNHLPTLGGTASYERSKSPSTLTLINTDISSIGLQLNFPIFEGGAVSSQVRQARAQFDSAEAQLESAYRTALSETTKAYNAITLGVYEILSGRSSVKFNKSALDHVEEGYNAGIQTTQDVIQQQNRLLAAQREFARNRYNYLANILLLQQAVGTLKPESLVQLQSIAISK